MTVYGYNLFFIAIMIRITRYCVVTDKDHPGCFRILNKDIPICPKCGSVLSGYDTRKRIVINEYGEKTQYYLNRLRCPVCNKVHTEIPDFILPYKNYEKEVIDSVLMGWKHECFADDSTIRRWIANYPHDLPSDSSK